MPIDIGRVGGGIERVFEFAPIAGIAFEIGVGDGARKQVLRVGARHQCAIFVGSSGLSPTTREEEELVVGLGELVEIGIVAHQASQGAFGERIVAEFLVFHHTGAEESIAQ